MGVGMKVHRFRERVMIFVASVRTQELVLSEVICNISLVMVSRVFFRVSRIRRSMSLASNGTLFWFSSGNRQFIMLEGDGLEIHKD